MDTQTIETRLMEIAERAEYSGRMRGIAKATRSSRQSKDATEAADLSFRVTIQMVTTLARELADPDGTLVVRFYGKNGEQIAGVTRGAMAGGRNLPPAPAAKPAR